jgi:hypothetical protein
VDANAKIAPAPEWLLDMLATGSKKRRRRVASDEGCSAKAAGTALGREVIIARLRCLKEPDKRTLMQKVINGKPFAIPGDRDNALQRIASILAFVAPDDEPEALASILEPSLAAMAAEYNDSDNPALTLDDAVEKIKRAQCDAQAKRATKIAEREAFLDKLTRRAPATDFDVAGDEYQQPGKIPGYAGSAGMIVDVICRQFELFRTPGKKFYASKGGSLWEIKSKEFKHKIVYFLHKSLGQVPSESTLN